MAGQLMEGPRAVRAASKLVFGLAACLGVAYAAQWAATGESPPSADAPGRVRLTAAAQNAVPPAPAADAAGQPAAEPTGDAPPPEVIHDADLVVRQAIDQAHAACFLNNPFPSAKQCGTCHPQHYREWSVSPHAYAQLSPVFNAMSNTLIKVTNGTQGDFCIRCHTPVGMALDEPINMSQMDRHPAAREGVTCVVCHRINQAWGKGAGRQHLVAGDIHQVVFGPQGNQILAEVFANPDRYGVLRTTHDPEVKGRDAHVAAVPFWHLEASGFCGACHDVFAPNGFRLEDAFSEYKQSPAAQERHVSCQDCHMGIAPGEDRGYACEPAARVGTAYTAPRKRTNHMFVGPDYSIIHPGLFPHHPFAIREEGEPESVDGLATMREWLLFEDAAGWGTDEFERKVDKDYPFPEPWKDQMRRIRARRILEDQHKLLAEAAMQRLQILRVGYRMDDIEVLRADGGGIDFRVRVYNGTDGHSVPTGFDAERLVFLRVNVWDSTGRLVYQSGDLDPNGDVRDNHSLYVHNGVLPLDRELFSLQTRFIIRSFRGGEREQVLTFPFSATALPFIRPETQPFTVLGRPVGARKHKQNIEIYGERYGEYHVGPERLTGCGPYTARVQLIAGMVPVNLVAAISGVGFDYGMSAEQIARNIVAGHLVLWERTATIPAP